MSSQNLQFPLAPRTHARLATHQEASERLQYALDRREPAVLDGPAGSGKSQLLRELQQQLQAEGWQGYFLDLTGSEAEEFAPRLALKLGLTSALDTSPALAWLRLEQWCAGLRELNHRHFLLIDHVDRAAGCDESLDRWLTLSAGAMTTLMATTTPCSERWQTLIRRHCALKIMLAGLSTTEAATFVSGSSWPRQVSRSALEALQELTQGKLRNFDRVLRLLELVAEEQGIDQIDEQLIRDVAQEVQL